MSTKRRAGEERSTSEGVDDLAGVQQRHDDAQRADTSEEVDLEKLEVPTPPDPSELDWRERRQAAKRKAAGPSKEPTPAAEPKAPPADSPPPSDPE